MTERNDISNFDGFDFDIDAFFSGLDEIKAPESIKSRTLEAMMAAVPSDEETDCNLEAESISDASDASDNATPRFKAIATSTSNTATNAPAKRMSRGRKIGVAAIAACLTLGCIGGGLAYATPSSKVLISNDSSFELNVNAFGIVISAAAANTESNDVLAEADVLHKSFSDSLDSLMNADKSNPASIEQTETPKVNVTIISDNEEQARALEESTSAVLSNHDVEAMIENPSADSDDESDMTDSDQPQPDLSRQEDQGDIEDGGDTPDSPISDIETQEEQSPSTTDGIGSEEDEKSLDEPLLLAL